MACASLSRALYISQDMYMSICVELALIDGYLVSENEINGFDIMEGYL